VFGNVKGAAAEAAEAKLIVLENLERGKIHNGSILRFSREGPTASTDLVGNALATAGGFDGAVRDLTETTEEGRLWVLGFLRQLQETGAGSVRFGDLVAVLARRVRAEWGARHADAAADVAWEGTEDFGSLVHLVHPDEGVESRERWERLKRLIPERISQLNRQKRVRERLLRVFAALVEAVEEGGHAPPTQAELTERTGVARATVSDDFGLLREIITGLDAPNPDE
jgi:hypothetical protein